MHKNRVCRRRKKSRDRGEILFVPVQFSSVAVMSNSLWPHGLQHARPPCPSSTPRVYSNSCPLSQWCHPTISSSVIPFSSSLQSFPPSGSFPVSQLFASGGQSIGVSASTSVLPMNIHDWFPFRWTGLFAKGWLFSKSDLQWEDWESKQSKQWEEHGGNTHGFKKITCDPRICMAKSLCSSPETITTLFVNWLYSNTK